ncbi:MMRN1 protein, partial [Amia calva]|nr:MMRN1 protein [Amia calva]
MPVATEPCYWSSGGCPERYQVMTRPAYKMRHTIVTSLEWKCCPGYIGSLCQPNGAQLLTQLRRVESNSAMRTASDEKQQSTSSDEKMADQMSSQEKKINMLQKKMDNVTNNMNNMKTVLYSLEGKINEGKGKDLQSTLKALKTKGIQDRIREIVQEQIKSSQNLIQETIAQLFKTMSRLTEELENTKETVKQLNGTMAIMLGSQKSIEENNNRMVTDIQGLKDQAIALKGDITTSSSNITRELTGKYYSLEEKFALEKQEKVVFYDTINHTLSQIKDMQGQLISGEAIHESVVLESQGSESENLTKHVAFLGDMVKKQTLLILQLQQEIYTQDIKISNLTSVMGRQRKVAQMTCETMAIQCKQDLQPQLEEIKGHINVLNKTLCDTVLPLDDMINVMEEKISHVSYEVEELKPIIEKDTSMSSDGRSDHTAELSAIKSRIEGLSSTLDGLSSSIKDVVRNQEELNNQTKDKEDQYLIGCRAELEDALNDTMTVINNAIDSVKDNYYGLEGNLESTNRQLSEISNDFEEKLKNSTALNPQLDYLNSSVLALQNKMEMLDNILGAIGVLSEDAIRDPEKKRPPNLVQLSQILKEAVSTLEEHKTTITHIKESHSNSSVDFGTYDIRLQNVESKVNLLFPNASSIVKLKKKPPPEGLAWKYKELNKLVQELSVKSFNLTNDILWAKENASKAWDVCQNLSRSVDMMQENAIQGCKEEKINLTLLQEELKGILQQDQGDISKLDVANPTLYLSAAMSSIFKDVTKLQSDVKQLNTKPEAMLELILNASSVLAGRSQRNTDNVIEPELASCSSSPCQNGGTCINEKRGYVCACRPPFGGVNCSVKLVNESVLLNDFSKGSYRYAPMVTFFVAHTYTMSAPGAIRFNHLYVNYGASYSPGSGKFSIPYLGVYVFKYTIESSSPQVSGYLVVDDEDKLAFQSEDATATTSSGRVITGDAVLELNYGQRVWLRLETGSIPAKYPPVTTFGGYLLYRT